MIIIMIIVIIRVLSRGNRDDSFWSQYRYILPTRLQANCEAHNEPQKNLFVRRSQNLFDLTGISMFRIIIIIIIIIIITIIMITMIILMTIIVMIIMILIRIIAC
jgi:hypothetical protein